MPPSKDYTELIRIKGFTSEEDLSKKIYTDRVVFKCEKGHSQEKKLKSIMINGSCNECKRLDAFKEIVDILNSHGYIVTSLEKDYKSVKHKIDYVCERGHNHSTTGANIKTGQKCGQCKSIHLSEIHRADKNEVIKMIEDTGYEIVEFKDYKNQTSRVSVKCLKGHIYDTSINNFYQGYRCNICGVDNTRGENHYLWNNGISNLNHFLRGQLTNWKIDSMKNVDYTCFVTGEKGNLHVHHTINFPNILKEIMNDLNLEIKSEIGMYSKEQLKLIVEKFINKHYEIGLGIVMLKDIHILFHSIYGNRNNNLQQVLEFKNDYLKGKYNFK